ncbi:MAG TPA: hypothetical protein VLJ44_11350 [Gaiellaceae bacterium]|nr:hypothetical protein [Gaiellaceae bacterium]
MTKSRKSHVVIAVAAASLAGAGAAVAESSHTHSNTLSHGLRGGGPGGMRDDLSVAATYLGSTESELRTKLRSGTTMAEVANATDGKSADGLVAALVDAAKKTIAADVSSGRLTQSQADGILPSLKQHVTARVNSTGPPGGPNGRGGPHGGLDAAAAYLGLSEGALRIQLQSGKTLGEVAGATTGKSQAGLIAALVADGKSHLDQAVKDGRLTQSQADAMAANIETSVTDLVNGELPPRA